MTSTHRADYTLRVRFRNDSTGSPRVALVKSSLDNSRIRSMSFSSNVTFPTRASAIPQSEHCLPRRFSFSHLSLAPSSCNVLCLRHERNLLRLGEKHRERGSDMGKANPLLL